MIDGAKLSFMETADIYVLFGNLMDNAMEAVGKTIRRGQTHCVRQRVCRARLVAHRNE